VHKILIISSGACFVVGTWVLAKSIIWQGEALAKGNNKLARAVRDMGSPGRTVVRKLRLGMILNAVGYALLVIAILTSP